MIVSFPWFSIPFRGPFLVNSEPWQVLLGGSYLIPFLLVLQPPKEYLALAPMWVPGEANGSPRQPTILPLTACPLGHRLPGTIESIAPAHQNEKASSQVPRLRTKGAWAPIMSTTVGSQGSPALPLRTKVREPRLKYRACAQK